VLQVGDWGTVDCRSVGRFVDAPRVRVPLSLMVPAVDAQRKVAMVENY
jgi:hypothetical protein